MLRVDDVCDSTLSGLAAWQPVGNVGLAEGTVKITGIGVSVLLEDSPRCRG